MIFTVGGSARVVVYIGYNLVYISSIFWLAVHLGAAVHQLWEQGSFTSDGC